MLTSQETTDDASIAQGNASILSDLGTIEVQFIRGECAKKGIKVRKANVKALGQIHESKTVSLLEKAPFGMLLSPAARNRLLYHVGVGSILTIDESQAGGGSVARR